MFSYFEDNTEGTISVNELDNLIGQIHLIDVREPYEFEEGHIKTAENIPMAKLVRDPEDYLDENETYYLICHAGIRSGRVAGVLKEDGYHVINVAGGMSAYTGKYEVK